MADYEVVRLLQNPLGQPAPSGQRGDIVRVTNGWATVYLAPAEFEQISEAGLLRMLAEVDPRPISMVSTRTPAGGRGVSIRDAGSRGWTGQPTPPRRWVNV